MPFHYTISLLEGTEDRWLDAATEGLGIPRAVLKLLSGEGLQRVRDNTLDAIIEWDRSVTRRSGVRPVWNGCAGIDYWPASDAYTPYGRTHDGQTLALTPADVRILTDRKN